MLFPVSLRAGPGGELNSYDDVIADVTGISIEEIKQL